MSFIPHRHLVQYYETDQMGVVHHSNYIRWFEETRVFFMDQMGFTGTRLTVSYRVIDAADKTLRAEGETRHCFLNRQGRPVSLKKENPAAFERFCALAGQELYEKIR